MIRFLLIVLCISIVITGCGRSIVKLDPDTPCDEIIHPALLSVPFEQLEKGREEAETWILTQFPTVTVEFQSSQPSGTSEIGAFYWLDREKRFTLALTQLLQFVSQISEESPTLGQILRCYGAPEYYMLGDVYIGGEGTGGVRLDLWYPERGLYISSVTWGSTAIRRYDLNSPIAGIIKAMPTGKVEEMMQHGEIRLEPYIYEDHAVLKKWPNNFTELVLEE